MWHNLKKDLFYQEMHTWQKNVEQKRNKMKLKNPPFTYFKTFFLVFVNCDWHNILHKVKY